MSTASTSQRAHKLESFQPVRYRLCLRHPDGRVERGGLRRVRAAGPRPGHAFVTVVDRQPVSWQIVEERIARDAESEPYLELVAERDYREREDILDQALAYDAAQPIVEASVGVAPAEGVGATEMVALQSGGEPRWEVAVAAVERLSLDDIGEDVLQLCGVDPDADPPETWLRTVRERLGSDLERFRADVEGPRDQIEQWTVDGTRVLASSGTWRDEVEPDKGHGWMCRLHDSGVLAAAGFERVRKVDL
jgi:hypothetical protein